ncbi:hypothetical protein LCI18_006574 [Fusarium solani-melongenae]|uniref:Uncharacterized protein n=1 Tax=Fusarium solani subsp. cucurbitae TaxID=2747967 RepID=A0ACD3Z332_FUSSC|nr:hypothetical protein LCI18_006574 [Fusarium solani-melongenae]
MGPPKLVAAMDSHDLLIDGCENWTYYPTKLLRPVQLKSTLEYFHKRLVHDQALLFDHETEAIRLLELNDGDDAYREGNFTHYSFLRGHLLENRKDPKSRFIFIQAAHSRSELSCSRNSFSYLCCFHQVDPSFLNFVFSFGSTDDPIDYHMTGFNSHDTLDVGNDRLLDIPKLGRSGREHCVQYLVRSLERDVDFDNQVTHKIRQMAVYHTFDFVTGKAFWINIKANDLMESRVREATTQLPALGSNAMKTLAGCFAATLAAHLIHLEWCDEDWREGINDIESKIRNVLTKAKTARIERQPKGMKRAFTLASTLHTSMTSTGGFSEKIVGYPSVKKKIRGSFKGLNSYDDAGDGLSTHPWSRLPRATKTGDRDQIDRLMVLDTFSFNEVQQLHYFGELLETFRLVMDLNDQTLRDIAENYQDLWERDGFPEEIKQNCKKELALFIRRVHRIRRNLQIRIAQVKSLMGWLQEGKTLFDGILQYRNVQIGRIFTESSQAQSKKMEGIAFKTEKETISMHVITCVTLAFLPAMFVATFFQSGLVEINKHAKNVGEAVNLHGYAFELFISICLPLMCVTFVLWVVVFQCLSRRARGRVVFDDNA